MFIPGAGATPWLWHLVEAELRARGRRSVAVDLPNDDDSAGLSDYTDAVVGAIGEHADPILVAHSLGAFTAPLVCEHVPVKMMILVSGMIPKPGETAADWWTNTGHSEALQAQEERDGWHPDDPAALFLHDLPPDIVQQAPAHTRDQSGTPFGEPWPLSSWPDVPTKFLLCRDDRFFPAEFMRTVVWRRLGIVPDEMGGGHAGPLSRPQEMVDWLQAYADGMVRAPGK